MAFHFSAVRHQAIIGTSAGTVLIGPLGNPLQWRHNGLGSVSNHQPHDCLLNRLFRRWSKKTTKIRVTGLCAGISPIPVNSPHKGPVTRKMFPFDDVIMWWNQDAVAIMQENENVVFRSFCFASRGWYGPSHTKTPGEFPAQRPVTRITNLAASRLCVDIETGPFVTKAQLLVWSRCC